MTTAMLIASPRRVLAHKDNNTPVRQQSALDNDLLKSPSRDATTKSHHNVPAFHIPPRTGEKRKRAGVPILDEAESRVGSKTARLDSQDTVARASLRHEPLSQLSLLGEDADLIDGELPNLTTSTSTLNTSSLNAPPVSTLPTSSQSIQDGVVIEEQFQLPEEMSQNSLEKIHAIKISHSQQHTSQLMPPTRPALLEEASQESFGMSAFIEYEKDGSDEAEGDVNMKDAAAQDDEMTMIQLPSSDIDPVPRVEDASNKSSDTPNPSPSPKLTQAADNLRTRLQLAMFKIESNQTRTPFSRLRLPGSRSKSPDLPFTSKVPPARPSGLTSRSYSVTPPIPAQTNSPESKIAAMRARMNNIKKPRITTLNSIPIPELQPGQYSARYMRMNHHAAGNATTARIMPAALSHHAQQQNDDEEGLVASQIFNSSPPPASGDDDNDDEPLNYDALDILPQRATAASSPPSTPIAELDEEDLMTAAVIGRGGGGARGLPSLTSSVVKGEAANGLLDLSRSFGA